MKELNCKLICDGGYWFIELPFNAGTIDLGSSINETIDWCYEFRVVDLLENGLNVKEIADEMDLDIKTIKSLKEKLKEELEDD